MVFAIALGKGHYNLTVINSGCKGQEYRYKTYFFDYNRRNVSDTKLSKFQETTTILAIYSVKT